LRAAHAEIQRQAATFHDARLRDDFLQHGALNREVEARWHALQPTPLVVQLARADAPLGKSLSATDFVSVRWTIDAGADDATILHDEGKTALRHQRLRRLLDEANTQGAAPTDADLARALGVNVRTIERDMAALKATGQRTHTRRRKS